MKKMLCYLLVAIMLAVLLCNSVFAVTTDIKTSGTLFGDVDGNGKTEVTDALLIQKHLAKMEILTDEQLSVSDVNGDGIVDIKDVTLIQKYVAEIILTFPVETTTVSTSTTAEDTTDTTTETTSSDVSTTTQEKTTVTTPTITSTTKPTVTTTTGTHPPFVTTTTSPTYYEVFGYATTGGNVTVSESGEYVEKNTEVTFTAKANIAYKFKGWYDSETGGNLVSESMVYTVVIKNNITLYAHFEKDSSWLPPIYD